MDSINSVKEFMLLFNQPVLKSPTVPSEARVKLRLSLSLEELSELAESAAALRDYKVLLEKKLADVNDKIESGKYEVPNMLGILDALIDMRYVNDGAIHEFGLGDIFNEGFNLVHKSNMSKACSNEKEAEETIEHYKSNNINTYSENHNGKWLVYRLEDKKVLKAKSWKEANCSTLIKL